MSIGVVFQLDLGSQRNVTMAEYRFPGAHQRIQLRAHDLGFCLNA